MRLFALTAIDGNAEHAVETIHHLTNLFAVIFMFGRAEHAEQLSQHPMELFAVTLIFGKAEHAVAGVSPLSETCVSVGGDRHVWQGRTCCSRCLTILQTCLT